MCVLLLHVVQRCRYLCVSVVTEQSFVILCVYDVSPIKAHFSLTVTLLH